MLEVKNVTKRYGKNVACNDVSFTLEPGTLTVLLGPNGAGKSTIIKSIIGFLKFDGSITVNGLPNKTSAARKVLGYIPEMPSLYPTLTVIEHMEFIARAYKMTDYKDRVNMLLERFELDDKRKKFGDELSKGMQQKLNLCLGLLPDPDIILLDEPTAYLDYPSKIAMMLLLHRLAKALKKTIFMSTHDLEHALQVADQVWLIDHEKGLTTGMPEDLSIDGSIEQYFAKENMMFDREACTFSIEYETARDIIVEGKPDTLEYRLCCKALMRNGMKPVASATGTNATTDVTIKIPGDGTYRLIEKGKETVKVEKMAHLLHMIVPAITKYHISAIREAAEMNQYE